jgi:hypothetical protein
MSSGAEANSPKVIPAAAVMIVCDQLNLLLLDLLLLEDLVTERLLLVRDRELEELLLVPDELLTELILTEVCELDFEAIEELLLLVTLTIKLLETLDTETELIE